MNSQIQLKKSSSFIVLAVLITVFQNFLMKLWFIEPGSIVNQIDEALMGLSLLLILVFRNKFDFSRLPKVVLYSFVSYWVFAIISSVFGDVVIGQVFLQGFLDLKFFVFLLFCVVFFDAGLVSKIDFLFKSILVMNVPFVIWQFNFQDSYDAIFASGAHFGLIYDSDGEGISRAAGLFWFTGIYALFCALSLGYFYAKKMIGTNFSKLDYFFLYLSVILLFLSLSRGEIASAIISLLAVNILYSGRRYLKPVAVFSTVFIFIIIAILYSVSLQKWATELGLISGAVELAPRALFMQSSLDIGQNYFPLGAGLGAFGGKAAVEYDSHFFYQYLISHEWYFNYGMYLTDTFWPKLIAESGFFGMAAFLSGIIFLIFSLLERKVESVYSVYAIVFMLVNSISTPVFNDGFAVVIAFSMIGVGFAARKE